MATKNEQLNALIEPVVTGLGYQLWGIDFASQGRHSVLRIFIDAEAGISVDDCAAVSRQVSGVMDVEDPISTEYTLEVSSPGMDRPLFTLEQFAQYVGHQVQVRLRSPYEGRRKFSGLLKGVEDEDVVVEVDQHEYLLPIDSIDKANVVPRFE
ncbi:ribosome maturation factor RimP [Motiliproteus coralliicola]|uniref:Ribosome maturation factor RimP n=1 Tax=Motiliproteus coralliicola TaxID=2283196 RepID=A0A369W8Y4_9GAMM|nr:ribosome maturation factor RimP [Motiliproteus coralliicola]RDE18107.1 ribosome maturation factor RimP [Motiliproteus coralliicola]